MDSRLLLDYIHEQPSVVKRIVEEVRTEEFRGAVAALQVKGTTLPVIYLLGSGSSLNAAYASRSHFRAAAECLEVFDPVNFTLDLEKGLVKPGSVVIGISQSGQSLATVEALKKAKNIDAKTIAVTAGKDSPLSRAADQTIMVNCGEERVGPKTKGYSATVTVLIGLAQCLQGHGLDYGAVRRIQSYLDNEKLLKDLVDRNPQTNTCFVIGSGDNFGTAREGALKIMEIAKIPSMYFDVEDSMHGPFTTVTENSFIIVLGIDAAAQERMDGLAKILERIRAKGCFVSEGQVQSLEGNVNLENLYCDSMADIVPIQLLSYYFALARGVNPIQMSYDRNFVRNITKLAQ